MREDVGPGVDDGVDRGEVPLEIADEGLDQDVGAELVEPLDGAADVLGAAVEEIVAVDHGHHDVLEVEASDGAGDVLRLADVDGAARIAGGHRAEAAAAGADVAEEHHRRGAFAPALADVGAAGLFADRVEIELAEGLLEVMVGVAPRARGP